MKVIGKFLSILILIISFSMVLFIGCSEDDPVSQQEEHFEAFGIAFFTNGNKIASIYKGKTNDTLKVTVNSTSDVIQIMFYDEEQNLLEPPINEKTLSWQIINEDIVEITQPGVLKNTFNFILNGMQIGNTLVEFFITHEGHSDFRSGHIPVIVE